MLCSRYCSQKLRRFDPAEGIATRSNPAAADRQLRLRTDSELGLLPTKRADGYMHAEQAMTRWLVLYGEGGKIFYNLPGNAIGTHLKGEYRHYCERRENVQILRIIQTDAPTFTLGHFYQPQITKSDQTLFLFSQNTLSRIATHTCTFFPSLPL